MLTNMGCHILPWGGFTHHIHIFFILQFNLTINREDGNNLTISYLFR